MSSSSGSERPTPADFRLAEWLVQPNLNRISRQDHSVQLEPKIMDVLVLLAQQPGEVVSKNEITDAVWPEVFITESVISRAIAGLRRAFGDDARQPRYIETISKRGYRLIAEVVAPPAATPSFAAPSFAAESTAASLGNLASASSPGVPYVVGQWVRGQTFYGRGATIAEVLTGNRNWLWLAGTRRIGKTSLLKQLELIAATTPDLGLVPLFWDLQGADNPAELHLDFADALLDAEVHLTRVGITLAEVQSENCFDSLARLRRKLSSQQLRLLLLCDEVEELIHLHQQDPSLLRKLRRALQSREGIRSVLASSPRLWCLADAGEDTSPFLDGFTPPLILGTLDAAEAGALIRQSQLSETSRPAFAEDNVTRIRALCGDHPYLIQILCRRALDTGSLETGSLDEAVEAVRGDRAVAFFFSVDFELLSAAEQAILRHLAAHPGARAEELSISVPEIASSISASLANLSRLGMARRDPEGVLTIGNQFLLWWLEGTPGPIPAI